MEPSKSLNALLRWARLPELRWLTLASLFSVSLGYLFPVTMVIEPGSGWLGALSVRDFHGAEETYRWTRDRSSIVFPDPGPGLAVRVEATVSGFRPPGQSPPWLVVQSEGTSVRAQAARGVETISLDTVTQGWWKSDHEVVFLSQTFAPTETDRRALGVRVHSVKLIPLGGLIGSGFPLGFPPVRQLLLTTCGLLFLFTLLVRAKIPPRRALYVGLALASVWGVAFAAARPYAALSSLATFWILALVWAASLSLPNVTRVVLNASTETARAASRGLRLLIAGHAAALALLSVIGVTVSYLSRPSLSIDLGSGEATLLARQFAGFDQVEGVKFRRALPGAAVDLRDFGGGSDWTIAITARLAGPSQTLVLARAGDDELTARLGTSWSKHTLTSQAPWGWRSGLEVAFPSASYPLDLRLDRIDIARHGSLPSVRVVVLVAGAVLLFLAACGASGLSAKAGMVLSVSLLLALLVALTAAPVLVIPFLPSFMGATAAGLAFASLSVGAVSALSKNAWMPVLPAGAVAAAAVGFMGWLIATLFPLYQGGHFVYHSSIAEEIWQGRFLTYYLPSPDNMLSIQKQWGNLVIPHPCFYHTVVSPLAMFPRGWFYGFEKAVLASMLASMSLAAAVLATRLGSARAGVMAAIVAISAPPTFQLLELGHLMTLFGCWAATLALSFVALRFEQLPERATWWGATVLLTLCFLSYTASLLFAATVVALAVPALYHAHPRQAKALATAAMAAAVAAFLLYYIHWTLPFLNESLPHILATAGSRAEGPSLWSRMAGVPRKLAFTYGTPVLPLAGILGLGLLPRSPARTVVFLWASILIFFSGIDLFFNLLLKHHYFVIVPLSVGLGLGTSWLSLKGRLGRWMALLFVVFFIAGGAWAGLRVALGWS